eukprot:3398294-Amphidinium_carterae.1
MQFKNSSWLDFEVNFSLDTPKLAPLCSAGTLGAPSTLVCPPGNWAPVAQIGYPSILEPKTFLALLSLAWFKVDDDEVAPAPPMDAE